MNRILNRVARFFVPVAVALALTACGSEPAPPPDNGPIVVEDKAPPTVANDSEPVPVELSLAEAARQGRIEYQMVGTGSSSGDSLRLRVRRTGPAPITLRVTPGTVFRSGSSGVQRMVALRIAGEVIEAGGERIRPADSVYLDNDEFREIVLTAYCLDFELENPSPQNNFEVHGANPRAAAILQAAQAQSFGVEATQAAIWLDAGVTGERIQEIFPATPQDIEQAAQLLANLPAT